MGAPMTRTAIRSWLAAVPLFSDLSVTDLEMLASTARSLSFQKHGRVFEQGAPSDCCFILVSGEARVVLSSGGETEVPIAIIRPQMLVGELSLLDGSTRSAALVASAACRFIRIPASSFEQLRRNSAFERRIVGHLAATLRDANDQVRGMSTNPSVARVAWCLGRIARLEGRQDGTGILIPKRPHHELAEMAGCSRETVTRALATLKRRKSFVAVGNALRLDVDVLQRYLHGELRLPGA